MASVFSSVKSDVSPLKIGSVKSNIGHSEPAAGISGLLKVVLSIENGVIPGNPTFVTPNPRIDFRNAKAQVSRNATRWNLPPMLRRAGVNSFGYGGSNAHVIVDSAEGLTSHISSYTNSLFVEEVAYSRPYVLVFSSNDEYSLMGGISAMDRHLNYPGVNVDLRDLAYTLSEKRTRHFQRGYIITERSEISVGSLAQGKVTQPPQIGLIFTGQGAQWPQMGKALIAAFPVAKRCLTHLDSVLQELDDGPKWCLLDELSQPRSVDYYRIPEVSQTLVTVLQLALLAVIEGCTVEYHAVAGHSSGEIAAAVAAGFLTPEQAIKVAYLRGKATSQVSQGVAVGMMAVGLSKEQVSVYLDQAPHVQVACINSPENITLSGARQELLELETKIKNDGHFARILLVDAAYHSEFMASVARKYRKLMLENCEWPCQTAEKEVRYYSTVKGRKLSSLYGAAYWEDNMASPVLFDTAIQEMLNEPLDLLIEVGPSNALSGPIHQIKKFTGSAIEYAFAWKRGPDPLTIFCDLAGKLFVKGSSINLAQFNTDSSGYKPSTIVDLPNYHWNHSTKYWHESSSSKDWRFRKFVHHDLLGSKVLGTPWQQPTWRKILRVQDVPWLGDHRLGETIVFPAAGYLAMAMEAAFQMQKTVGNIGQNLNVDQVTYRLRNCRFLRAMALEEDGAGHEILLTLTPRSGPEKGWCEFTISTMVDGLLNKHSNGLIRIEAKSICKTAKAADIMPLQHSTTPDIWYKAMKEVGYVFGPSFQMSLAVESTAGSRTSRSLLSFDEPQSSFPQSTYPLHPTNIDACFQAVAGSIWAGDRTAVSIRLVPDAIDELIIPRQNSKVRVAIATATSKWTGVGRKDDAKSYMSDVSAFDQETHELVYDMHGLRYQILEAENAEDALHTFNRSTWGPDISALSKEQLDRMLGLERSTGKKINRLLDMIAFKKPDVSVLEVMSNDSAESLWIDGGRSDLLHRSSNCSLHLELSSHKAFAEASSKFQNFRNITVHKMESLSTLKIEKGFDVLIMNGDIPIQEIPGLLQYLHQPDYIIVKCNGEKEDKESTDKSQQVPSQFVANASPGNNHKTDALNVLGSAEFLYTTQVSDLSSTLFFGRILASNHEIDERFGDRCIDLLHFSSIGDDTLEEVLARIQVLGWKVQHHHAPFTNVKTNRMALVLDKLFISVLAGITEEQWTGLQALLSGDCRILWVTRGAQMAVTNPGCSLIQGFARSICNENPTSIIMTLDVESSSGANTITAIDQTLHRLHDTKDTAMVDTEFIERDGILHIGRVVPDGLVNKRERYNTQRKMSKELPLFEQESCVRFISTRPGTLDSLHYAEVSDEFTSLPEGYVEVEIHAVSLNFKDLAIAMDLVPGNEHLLGLDGAGVVRRLGDATGTYRIGQKVLANRKGSLANRVQCSVDGEIFPIPDEISFIDASTLNTVYSTALYSLTDLSHTKPGQSVLIHSAAGGFGIAAVQICNYLGAEIYATVGSDEKRRFLADNYNVRLDRIFSSRTTDFATDLMAATNGRGVDAILNTLTGEMLHESWRCIAVGGTFIELGKRDILDKERISMEPFNRNATYCAVDMSHESIPSALKAR